MIIIIPIWVKDSATGKKILRGHRIQISGRPAYWETDEAVFRWCNERGIKLLDEEGQIKIPPYYTAPD